MFESVAFRLLASICDVYNNILDKDKIKLNSRISYDVKTDSFTSDSDELEEEMFADVLQTYYPDAEHEMVIEEADNILADIDDEINKLTERLIKLSLIKGYIINRTTDDDIDYDYDLEDEDQD